MLTRYKMCGCVLAAVAALGVSASEFLDSLVTNEHRVASSPYAAGGDVILLLSAERNEYVHIFTNAVTAGVFRPSQAIPARVFAVGGGGGGGSGWAGHGGGGGAGGFVERYGVDFAADTDFEVVVGKGGASVAGNDWQLGGKGGNSTVNGITAYGGGGGGGHWGSYSSCAGTDGDSGGSGGGGGGSQVYAGTGGSGVDGQGHAGGKGDVVAESGSSSCSSGGGGGAGASGGNARTPQPERRKVQTAGYGGEGRTSSILGAEIWFAGGGGGGSYGRGGLGGGGDGSKINGNNGCAGADGLGGGGGGAECNSNGAASGRGGSGLVAVRYAVCDPAIRVLSTEATLAESGAAAISVRYMNYDTGAPTVSATLEVWPVGDPSGIIDFAIADGMVSSNLCELTLSHAVAGLTPDVDYRYRFNMTNGGGASTSVENSFRMAQSTCKPDIAGLEDGDYVVKHGVDVSDEIYIFTNVDKTATFTPRSDGYVRLLVVGGGGAGYQSGYSAAAGGSGGGGGGVVYLASHYVRAGKGYSIKVGKGSKAMAKTFWSPQSENGEDSCFGNVIAYGGGAGGGMDNYLGGCGGSGGGGGNRLIGGASIAGQGHAGGTNTGDSRPGGGGGAGAPGGLSSDTKAADGGDGVSYDISGELTTYGGGGAAGVGKGYEQGIGGAGGGGNGCTYDLPPGKGVDGLGGGGGGGNMGNSSCTFAAADGGSGVVIVRFTDKTKLSHDPKFTALCSNVGKTSVDVEVAVSYFGVSSDSVTVTAKWGYSADDLCFSKVLSTAHSATATYTVDGLNPGRDYVMVIAVDNAEGGSADSPGMAFTTKSGLDADLQVAHCNYAYDFTFTVSEVGSGAVTATLCTGLDEENLAACETVTITEPGTYVLTHTYPVEWRTKAVCSIVRLDATEGGRTWSVSTEKAVFTMDDNSVYVFSANGGVGNWSDPGSWTSESGGTGLGYPGGAESKAMFAAGTTNEVRLTESAHPGWLDVFSAKNAAILFKGLADGIVISPVHGKGDYIFGEGLTLVVDHATIDFVSGVSWPKFSARQGLVLRNGASYSYGAGVEMQFYNDAFLSVESGSTFRSTDLRCNPTSRVRVDDATVSIGSFLPTFSGGSGAMRLEVAGANPCFSCSSASTGSGPVSVLFDPPRDPSAWVEAPVRSTGGFATGSFVWTVNLPVRKAVKLSRTGRRRDIPLVYAASGITTNNIVFGTNPFSNCSFVYSDDLKTLYYRYVPGNGIVLSIR